MIRISMRMQFGYIRKGQGAKGTRVSCMNCHMLAQVVLKLKAFTAGNASVLRLQAMAVPLVLVERTTLIELFATLRTSECPGTIGRICGLSLAPTQPLTFLRYTLGMCNFDVKA